MSIEVANDKTLLGQFASNGGYTDFVEEVHAAKDLKALLALIDDGASESVPTVVKDLDAFIADAPAQDVIDTAKALRDLIVGQDIIIVSDGTSDDGDVEKGEPDDEDVEVVKAGNGIMLAFWPPAEVAAKLSVEGGEPSEQLHITLAYFGKLGEVNMSALPALERAVEHFANTHAPVPVALGGLGRFPATPQSDGKDVMYLGVHSDGIQDFRQELVDAVQASGVQPKSTFGWNPHITLKRVAPHAPPLMPTPTPIDLTFNSITLNIGGAKKEYALVAPPEITSSEVELTGTIIKLDNEKHLVFGWFSVVEINGRSIEDTQGDLITPETIEESAYEFVLNARTGGEMHGTDPTGEVRGVGFLVESCVFTQEKQEAMVRSLNEQGIYAIMDLGCVCWWGGMKIHDDATWAKITTGELKAWSIGGRGKRDKIEKFSEDQPRDDHGRWGDGTGVESGPRTYRTTPQVSAPGESKLPEGHDYRSVVDATVQLGRDFVEGASKNDAVFQEAREKVAWAQNRTEAIDKMINTEGNRAAKFWATPPDKRDIAVFEKSQHVIDNLVNNRVRVQTAMNEANGVVRERLVSWVQEGSVGGPVGRPISASIASDVKNPERIKGYLSEFEKMVGGTPKDGRSGVVIAHTDDARSYHSSYANTVAISDGVGRETVFHEMGHWWEAQNPLSHEAAVAFLEHRTAGETARPINELKAEVGIRNYGAGRDETARPDKFADSYTGKIYNEHVIWSGNKGYTGTEIISMGFQQLAESPGQFYKNDPEYFNFILGVIQTGHK